MRVTHEHAGFSEEFRPALRRKNIEKSADLRAAGSAERRRMMETLWLPVSLDGREKTNLQLAAATLCTGGIVAIPTETVYGLAANALDENAVRKIFAAKERPQDNPLIIHIAEPEDIDKYCEPVPALARRLALRFWPGPLTMVLRARPLVPKIVTGGLDTVAVRCPAHPVALAILREAGVPLAAPSANRSGAPSPTDASHVKADLDGRIDAIVASGPCSVGVESTVVDLTGDTPVLLRPGGVTRELLLTVLDGLETAAPLSENSAAPSSPGMKYRHYAPAAPLTLLRGSAEQAARHVCAQPGKTAVLIFEEDRDAFAELTTVVLSSRREPEQAARRLFSSLRRLDALRCDALFAQFPEEGEGLWHTVCNRLSKAAGQQIADVGSPP